MVEMITSGIILVLGKLGYTGIFAFMFLEGACIPVPSEVILPFGGFLVNKGSLNLIITILMGTTGAAFGSTCMYFLGKYGGRPLIDKYINTLRLSESKMEKGDRFFQKYGEKVVFFSQMIPVIRTFISLPAGISKMDIKKFIIYTFLGTIIWASLLVSLGYIMGENWVAIRSWFHILDIIIAAAAISFIFYRISVLYFKKTRKGA